MILSKFVINRSGQSWNALTVGAFTDKVELNEPEFIPVADQGALSPFTTTSMGWEPVWPFKPDVVLRGIQLLTQNLSITLQFRITNNKCASSHPPPILDN
ncbi:S8 family serine peptidase [Klebsiella pneumoniae]